MTQNRVRPLQSGAESTTKSNNCILKYSLACSVCGLGTADFAKSIVGGTGLEGTALDIVEDTAVAGDAAWGGTVGTQARTGVVAG